MMISYEVTCCICKEPTVVRLPVSVEFQEDNFCDAMCSLCSKDAWEAEEAEIDALVHCQDEYLVAVREDCALTPPENRDSSPDEVPF